MTEATKCRADRKYKLLRSYRVTIRCHYFSLLKARSIRFRCRYSSRSYSQGSLRFDLGGMTASAPYPWSAMTAPVSIPVSGVGPGRHPPAVRRCGRNEPAGPGHQPPDEPWCSVRRGSGPEPHFGPPFATGRLLMGPHYGGINHHVDVVRVSQQHLEDLLPDSRPGPAGEPFADAFLVAVPRGQVFPLGAAAQHPQYAIRLSLAVYPHPAGHAPVRISPPGATEGRSTRNAPSKALHRTTLAQLHSTSLRGVPPRLLQSDFAQLSIRPSSPTTLK